MSNRYKKTAYDYACEQQETDDISDISAIWPKVYPKKFEEIEIFFVDLGEETVGKFDNLYSAIAWMDKHCKEGVLRAHTVTLDSLIDEDRARKEKFIYEHLSSKYLV